MTELGFELRQLLPEPMFLASVLPLQASLGDPQEFPGRLSDALSPQRSPVSVEDQGITFTTTPRVFYSPFPGLRGTHSLESMGSMNTGASNPGKNRPV